MLISKLLVFLSDYTGGITIVQYLLNIFITYISSFLNAMLQYCGFAESYIFVLSFPSQSLYKKCMKYC